MPHRVSLNPSQESAQRRELEDLHSNGRQAKSSIRRLEAAAQAASSDLHFLRQQLDVSEASRRRLEAAMLDDRATAEKAKQQARSDSFFLMQRLSCQTSS